MINERNETPPADANETLEQFCERVHREVGVTPELRKAYEFYLRHESAPADAVDRKAADDWADYLLGNVVGPDLEACAAKLAHLRGLDPEKQNRKLAAAYQAERADNEALRMELVKTHAREGALEDTNWKQRAEAVERREGELREALKLARELAVSNTEKTEGGEYRFLVGSICARFVEYFDKVLGDIPTPASLTTAAHYFDCSDGSMITVVADGATLIITDSAGRTYTGPRP